VPHLADGEAGIGRQLVVHDINGDGLLDIAAGGMKGAHVLLHRREAVSEARWREVQPAAFIGKLTVPLRGGKSAFDAAGRVPGAVEGETLAVLSASGGKTAAQKMAAFRSGKWSGGEQLLWSGAKPGDRLDLELIVEKEGTYDLLAAFTLARDYGKLRLALDDEPLGEQPLDLYNYPEVLASGEIELGRRKLAAGKHRLTLAIEGANASAIKSHLVGLDYLRPVPR
jgi:hypothetical protein